MNHSRIVVFCIALMITLFSIIGCGGSSGSSSKSGVTLSDAGESVRNALNSSKNSFTTIISPSTVFEETTLTSNPLGIIQFSNGGTYDSLEKQLVIPISREEFLNSISNTPQTGTGYLEEKSLEFTVKDKKTLDIPILKLVNLSQETSNKQVKGFSFSYGKSSLKTINYTDLRKKFASFSFTKDFIDRINANEVKIFALYGRFFETHHLCWGEIGHFMVF
jgi:hypothetical protein